MKIEDFRNTTLVVDHWPMLTFWFTLTSIIISWLNSVTWYANGLQISSQSDENWGFYKSSLCWSFGLCWPQKLIGGWVQRPNLQVVFKFQVNQMKIEDFRKFVPIWPISRCRPFGRPNFTKLQCGTVARSVSLICENFRMICWAVWAGGERPDKQTKTHTQTIGGDQHTCQKMKIFCQVTNKHKEGWKNNLLHLLWRRY